MKRRLRDEEREQRITMEIVVDAYTPEEQAMGWYYCEGEQGRCARRRPRPGLTRGTTGVLPSGRSVDQFPGTPPGAPSADGVTSEEPGLGPRRSTVRRLAVGAVPANRRAGRDEMASLPTVAPQVTVGVDSHKDVHVAAAVDHLGRVLGTTWVPTTTRGAAQLLRWATRLGTVQRFGIEGTGASRLGSAAGCNSRATRSWRSTAPTGRPAGAAASPTR